MLTAKEALAATKAASENKADSNEKLYGEEVRKSAGVIMDHIGKLIEYACKDGRSYIDLDVLVMHGEAEAECIEPNRLMTVLGASVDSHMAMWLHNEPIIFHNMLLMEILSRLSDLGYRRETRCGEVLHISWGE